MGFSYESLPVGALEPTWRPQRIGLTGEAGAAKIEQFLIDPEHLAKMEGTSRNLARPEAVRETVQACLHRLEAKEFIATWQNPLVIWITGSQPYC
jgi:hypothetical protein